jgi:5'-nucleotidase
MATRFVMKNKPDVIVSGINKGANLGNDIYYSGTVAAAREGSYWGVKSFAVSLCPGPDDGDKLYWDTASHFAKLIVEAAWTENYPVHTVININVPNLPLAKIKGLRLSQQGRRFYTDEITDRVDPRHKHYYWLGGEYKGFENIPGSDCVNVDQGFVSITPLKIDSTDYDHLGEFKKWEKQIQF